MNDNRDAGFSAGETAKISPHVPENLSSTLSQGMTLDGFDIA